MNVLLAGETFAATTSVAIGGDVLTSATAINGATAFNAALAAEGIAVTQIGGERCAAEFPYDVDALAQYQAVVISDVGALTLLVTPDARAGRVGVNRLDVLKAYVESGGGLMLAGGYMGFQGMFGTARFHDTAVEDVLPVRCFPWKDGLEAPEGLHPSILFPSHPILSGVDQPMPPILGLNKVDFRRDGTSSLVATCPYRGTNWPLLATREYGKGRSVAWTTDIGPHWLSLDFLAWPLYGKLMANIIRWLARDE
jgi:uncharacterized membrane protein